MYYARDDLPLVVFGVVLVGRHDLGRRDGVGGAILEEKSDECAEGIYKETNDNKIYKYEDLRASAHCNMWLGGRRGSDGGQGWVCRLRGEEEGSEVRE